MPWPVLLFIIFLLLAAFIAVLLLLKVTAVFRLCLYKRFVIQLHIKLYRFSIKKFEFYTFPKKKKSKKGGKLPKLKFIDTELRLYGAIGLLDAKNTALAAGGLSSLYGVVLGGVGQLTNLKKGWIRVDPIYSENRLFLESACIARAKAGHIIIAYIRYLLSKKKRVQE